MNKYLLIDHLGIYLNILIKKNIIELLLCSFLFQYKNRVYKTDIS